jgi:hypothetical protein
VVAAAALVLVAVVLVSLIIGRLGLFFDLAFVVVCIAAALAVRPQDFFTVGVLPPLLLAATVTAVAVVDPAAVARADDAVAQAVVSGLAHHAIALVIGYALTLGVIALRQVALRHEGRIRLTEPSGSPGSEQPHLPHQRRPAPDLAPAAATDEQRH